MNTKQKLSLALVLLSSLVTFGQKNWNRVSIETGYGYVSPSKLFGSTSSTKSDFSGFKHFDLGVRYMIGNDIGIKLSYANDRFSHDNEGTTLNSFDLAAVYNIGNLFDLTYNTNETLGLLGHAGVGIAFGKPERNNKAERIGTVTIGLTPLVRISDRVSAYVDYSYAFRLKQQFGYDGILLTPEYASKVGKTSVLSFGLIFYIGENNRHADWY